MQDERDSNASGHLSRGQLLRGTAATAAALAAAGSPRLGSAAPDSKTMAKLLGVDPKYAGKGLTFDLGMVFPLTGSGAIFGNRITDLPKKAFQQIVEMGGPTFNPILKDNVSGLASAGVEATRELGAKHVSMMLTSYAADLGAQNPEITHYKILSLDGSGGTSLFAQSKPYFYGAIAITPDDSIPGLAKFVAKKIPSMKKVSAVGWDLGDISVKIAKHIQSEFNIGHPIEYGGFEPVLIGETDFSAPLQKIKSSNPDVVVAAIYAEDQGYFLKQYATSGINKPVVTFASSPQAAQIAGAAYSSPNLYFCFDQFFPQAPSNPFAEYFVESFKSIAGGALPDFYSANFYEEIFVLWDCVRRVLKAGGNPKDGAQLDAALRKNPTFPSVYGGSKNEIGKLVFNLKTNSVAYRPMSISQYRNGQFVPLATFNVGGTDFKMVG
jgi:branched-chain amino acid transport system substrate-binding protein